MSAAPRRHADEFDAHLHRLTLYCAPSEDGRRVTGYADPALTVALTSWPAVAAPRPRQCVSLDGVAYAVRFRDLARVPSLDH